MKAQTVNEFIKSKNIGKNIEVGIDVLLKKEIDYWFYTNAPNTEYEISPSLNIYVYSSINLNSTGIKDLPDNMTISGNLWLGNNPIDKLPNNLYVKGNLDIERTKIKSIPDDLQVGEKIWYDAYSERISGFTSVEELRQHLESNSN